MVLKVAKCTGSAGSRRAVHADAAREAAMLHRLSHANILALRGVCVQITDDGGCSPHYNFFFWNIFVSFRLLGYAPPRWLLRRWKPIATHSRSCSTISLVSESTLCPRHLPCYGVSSFAEDNPSRSHQHGTFLLFHYFLPSLITHSERSSSIVAAMLCVGSSRCCWFWIVMSFPEAWRKIAPSGYNLLHEPWMSQRRILRRKGKQEI